MEPTLKGRHDILGSIDDIVCKKRKAIKVADCPSTIIKRKRPTQAAEEDGADNLEEEEEQEEFVFGEH